ncbi:hypothetical protein [Novosphingobium sp. P6W]|uniref:hypothetical protein n=1 Tax=Novosphingobium sp. P6W TaxID=1609758 RepID=UPI0005C6BE78|nr:hypothetical protein [Novosphingobium sp. P6W]AXB80053.1 hypothetical protein TQ38_025915 [Novosphingobium sp. P6W]
MTHLNNERRPETQPGVASAEDGLVILDGPDGVAVTMTAAAAAETGHNVVEAARAAQMQIGTTPGSDEN